MSAPVRIAVLSRDGSSAKNILVAARSYGMEAHAYSADVDSIKEEGQLLLGVIIFMVCQMIAVQLINGITQLLLTKIGTKLSLSVESTSMMRLFSMQVSRQRRDDTR